jgi:hypothetical protein
MATNAKPAADDSTQVTDDDLRKLKENPVVETSTEGDETEETNDSEDDSKETGDDDKTSDSQDEEAEDDSQDDSEEATSDFVKEFSNIKGDTPEEYARNLEIAYKNSTAEAIRLKNLTEANPPEEENLSEDEDIDMSNPVALFMKQKMDEEITDAYADFQKEYDQVNDQNDYSRFTRTVAQLSNTILQSEKRLASPKELYSKSAIILGWDKKSESSDRDKLGNAVKDRASSSRTSSATKPNIKSKISDAEVQVAKQLWGQGKSDAQIRKELEAVT